MQRERGTEIRRWFTQTFKKEEFFQELLQWQTHETTLIIESFQLEKTLKIESNC